MIKKQVFMRFPGGQPKALTLSYDDGVEQDIKLIELLNKHGIKGTFNINTSCYSPEGKTFAEGTIHRRMSHSMALDLYKNSGHEVAVHTATHPWLEQLPPSVAAEEVLEDRRSLEADYGKPIRGMAYPYGTFNDTVVEVLKNSGIVYSRTTISNYKFEMPKDWLRLEATCHHNYKDLMTLADKFVKMNVESRPQMFYLWGHTYEFEANNNWNVIEEFCEFIGGKEDIWYATNMEIYEYTEAYKRLVWGTDLDMVYNPSAIPVTFLFSHGAPAQKDIITVAPGETLKLG